MCVASLHGMIVNGGRSDPRLLLEIANDCRPRLSACHLRMAMLSLPFPIPEFVSSISAVMPLPLHLGYRHIQTRTTAGCTLARLAAGNLSIVYTQWFAAKSRSRLKVTAWEGGTLTDRPPISLFYLSASALCSRSEGKNACLPTFHVLSDEIERSHSRLLACFPDGRDWQALQFSSHYANVHVNWESMLLFPVCFQCAEFQCFVH